MHCKFWRVFADSIEVCAKSRGDWHMVNCAGNKKRCHCESLVTKFSNKFKEYAMGRVWSVKNG